MRHSSFLSEGYRSHGGPWSGFLPNQRITSIPDEQALRLVNWSSPDSDGARDSIRLRLEREWFRNIRFYLGIQGSTPPQQLTDQDLWIRDSGLDGEFQANMLPRILSGQVSRLSSSKGEVSVTPKSQDIEDEHGARVGKAFLDYWNDTFKFRKLRREGATWSISCGTHFVWADWDKRGGDTVEEFKVDDQWRSGWDGTDNEKDLLRKVGMGREKPQGWMDMRVLNPFQVHIPNPFTELDDAPWAIFEFDRSLEWIWNHYPEKARGVRPEDSDSNFSGQFRRRLHSLSASGGYTQGRQTDSANSITVRELWIPPSRHVPKGARIVATRTMLLEKSDHPYHAAGLNTKRDKFLRYPATRIRYLPVMGRFWGKSLIEDLIDPQREYNRTRQQAHAMRDILATPQWMAPNNAGLATQSNDYGVIWTYNPYSAKPELVPSPPMSQMHVESSAQNIQDMQMISAQSDASQARSPENVRSGIALRALQEQDLMVMGPTIEDIEDGWREVQQRLLALTWKFLNRDVAVTIYGHSRGSDVAIFKGSEINGNTQVRITEGSMVPQSSAGQRAEMMDMVQAGVLNPMDPNHQRVIAKTMAQGFGGMQEMHSHQEADERRADIENWMFMTAFKADDPLPDVDPDDDHAVHLSEHMRFKKTDTYEMFSPAKKLAFEAHMNKHRRELAAEMQAAQLMAGAGQSGGGGSEPKEPGEASQPRERKPTPGSKEN